MTPSPQSLDPQAIFNLLAAALKAQGVAEQQAKPQTTTNRLLTAKQAGEYLGRTESAIRQLIQKKQLPVVRFGRNIRIDVRDLEKIVDDYKV